MTDAGAGRRVAVVDIGSNSTRLFLCTGCDAAGPAGERATTITALRRGARDDGTLAADAVARLDACLADYGRRIRDFGADAVAAVATSAVRDAPNRDEVLAVVAGRLGAPCEVLTGDEEASLAYAGARLAVEDGAPALVVDVGGGSTEVVYGAAGLMRHGVSLQLGSVRCTEDHLRGDPPGDAEREALARHVAAVAGPALRDFPPGQVVGVAGTVTTLAAILLGGYDPVLVHGMRLGREEIAALTERLASVPLQERRRIPGLEPERAPVIVAGAVIVLTVLDLLGAPGLVVSERDILDGIALRAGCADP
ncbi:MAG: hypothetical protein AB1416_10800 [Actinomycetota bacterium]